MATYKALPNSSLPYTESHLECEMCGSTDIVDTTGGYVCRECGIVLEIQKLLYNRPYKEKALQHAIRNGPTQIGTSRERAISPNSINLNRLSLQNLIVPIKQKVVEQANIEISRLFANLNLGDYESLKEMVLEKFKDVRPKLRKGVKYRNTEKLVAVISYFCFKLRNVSMNISEFLEASQITRKEFNDFCYQVSKYIPEYMERNRQEYILNRVFEISQHFGLGMEFFHLARKILKKLWNGIKGTTDNALAGLVSSISLLCSRNEDVTVSAICTRLGIRMSTVQAQVKKKILRQFRVSGFISLIKSSDLLLPVMRQLGVLEQKISEPLSVVEDTSEIVEVILGNASKVFNAVNHVNYYYYVIKGEENTLVFINLGIYDFDESTKKFETSQGEAVLGFMLYQYPLPTGPP